MGDDQPRRPEQVLTAREHQHPFGGTASEPRPAACPHPAGGGRPGRRYGVTGTAGSPPPPGAVIVVLTYFPLVFVLSNSLKSGQGIFSSGVFSLFTQFDSGNYVTAWSGISHAAA